MIKIKKNIVILTSGPLAQLVEQFPFKEWVAGSNPARLTIKLKFFVCYSTFINTKFFKEKAQAECKVLSYMIK